MAPEQVLVLLGAGPQQLAVGGRDVGGDQVVAGESIAAVEPAQPAAEREPGDPGCRHHSQRRRQPERLGCAVELSQREPGSGPDPSRRWVNPKGLHGRQVKHEGAVAHRVPCHAVPAPAHREWEVVSTRDGDAADHLGGIHRPDHDERAPIDHAVEHGAGRVIATVAGPDDLPPQTSLEVLTNSTGDPASVHCHRIAPLRSDAGPRGAPGTCRSVCWRWSISTIEAIVGNYHECY